MTTGVNEQKSNMIIKIFVVMCQIIHIMALSVVMANKHWYNKGDVMLVPLIRIRIKISVNKIC